jgi:hypothetical protein
MRSRGYYLAPIVYVVCSTAISAQQPPHPYALTPERFTVALTDSKLGPPLSLLTGKINRFDLRLFGDFEISDVGTIKKLMDEAPFDVYILTPFARAVATAADARRRFAEVPALNMDELNRVGIIVSVTPGSSFIRADSIDDVVLLVGLPGAAQTVVRPYKKDLQRQIIYNSAGAEKAVMTGAFYFLFTDFDRLPATLTCIGAGGNYTLRLTEGDIIR